MPTIRNTPEQATETPLDVPHRPDGSPYRFEMIYDAFSKRAYADTADDLIGYLVGDYQSMGDEQRLAARIKFAVHTQVVLQASLNGAHADVPLSETERAIVEGHRNTPPHVQAWNSDLPLVLVDLYYAPVGDLPRPQREGEDVAEADNVLWLSPVDSYDLVESLHRCGAITLNRHTSATP